MNIGADDGSAPAASPRCDVPELVHEHQHDEADRELPAPEEGVGGDRDEHRAGDRKSLNLKIAAKTNLSFQKRKPTAAIGAQSFRSKSLRVGPRLIGEYSYSGSASRGA